jgi:hypothetical protein
MTRSIRTIAHEVTLDWVKPNYAAVPYLDAMRELDSIRDKYYYDSAESVVRYFLANATTWKGDAARAIKAELKAMLKGGK